MIKSRMGCVNLRCNGRGDYSRFVLIYGLRLQVHLCMRHMHVFDNKGKLALGGKRA